ncbi:hypothetical protein IAU59_004779 [Kwoniella sp. CBS 9459]
MSNNQQLELENIGPAHHPEDAPPAYAEAGSTQGGETNPPPTQSVRTETAPPQSGGATFRRTFTLHEVWDHATRDRLTEPQRNRIGTIAGVAGVLLAGGVAGFGGGYTLGRNEAANSPATVTQTHTVSKTGYATTQDWTRTVTETVTAPGQCTGTGQQSAPTATTPQGTTASLASVGKDVFIINDDESVTFTTIYVPSSQSTQSGRAPII